MGVLLDIQARLSRIESQLATQETTALERELCCMPTLPKPCQRRDNDELPPHAANAIVAAELPLNAANAIVATVVAKKIGRAWVSRARDTLLWKDLGLAGVTRTLLGGCEDDGGEWSC